MQQEEDSQPLVRYDLSLLPKFWKSPMSLINITMVEPIDDASEDNTLIMRGNRNQQGRSGMLLTTATNEKIDRPKRVYSSLLSFNRQIIVNEQESVLRYVNDKQVMNLSFRLH